MLLISRNQITKKDGKQLIIANGISENGRTYTVFGTPGTELGKKLLAMPVLEEGVLQALYNENPRVDVDYNDKGFLNDVNVVR